MAPHSSDQFGEQRDYWWNANFLDLMARRWKLADAHSLADIGCGVGHWSRLLFRYLSSRARLVGVDREAEWVDRARQNFAAIYPAVGLGDVEFLQGDAQSIPLADDSFDVVTCQTLLMHLADPKKALAEMIRIARPGGIIICVEPNNLFNIIGLNSLSQNRSPEQLVRKYEFWLRYQRGKIALSQGNHAIGDLVPGLFAAAGLTEIMVHQSDRTAPLFPPYSQPEQLVLLEQDSEWKETATGPWNRDDLSRCVLAGGGTEEFFEAGWGDLEREFVEQGEAIRTGQFHAAGGGLLYLVAGRKPRASASPR